jgi:hypothetical protein
MKFSLVALIAGCAIAGSAFAAFENPPITPPHVAQFENPPITPPHTVVFENPPITPPHNA